MVTVCAFGCGFSKVQMTVHPGPGILIFLSYKLVSPYGGSVITARVPLCVFIKVYISAKTCTAILIFQCYTNELPYGGCVFVYLLKYK